MQILQSVHFIGQPIYNSDARDMSLFFNHCLKLLIFYNKLKWTALESMCSVISQCIKCPE